MRASTFSSSSANNPAERCAEEFQVLLFKLGTKSFGVPLEHVRSIAPMPPDFESCGAEAENHFVFLGGPLTYVSLWDELNLKSKYFECVELLAMLPLRLKDHVDWMDALENSIQSGTPFAKARDPHQCAFGKWYYGYKAEDSRLSMLLHEFEKPHATIHALADRLLGLVAEGKAEEAKREFVEAKDKTLPILTRLFDVTQKRLLEMQKRIVIILTDGDNTWACGADDAQGITAVPNEQVAQLDSQAVRTKSKAVSTLIVLSDESVVPLLDWKSICSGG